MWRTMRLTDGSTLTLWACRWTEGSVTTRTKRGEVTYVKDAKHGTWFPVPQPGSEPEEATT